LLCSTLSSRSISLEHHPLVQAGHSATASKFPGVVACLVLNLAGAIHKMEILDGDDVVGREKQNRG
jgi:hypothetical protein